MEPDPSMEQIDAIADSVDAVVFVTDLSMRMLLASSSLERKTGFTAADFQFPQADNPFIHREDAERVASFLGAFVTSDARVSEPIENRFLDRWGRTHHYRSIVTKLRQLDTPALLFVCTEPDAPAPVERDDGQYRALVEAAEDAIVRLDAQGRFLFANRQASESFGYSLVELGRLRMHDLVIEADRPLLDAQLASRASGADSARFELHLVTKGGRELCAHVVLSSLLRVGAPKECLAILRDITADKRAAAERAALEERVREAQKLETLGLLAGGIAHDFNNLLAVITANAGLCRQRFTHGQDGTLQLDEIDRASARAAALCSQMLAYAGKSELAIGAVDLNALVSEITELTKAAVSKRATFSVVLGDDVPCVRGNAGQLQQVVMNLLVNAAESLGDAAGSVTISTRAATLDGALAALLRVSDTGRGMDAATQAHMFDPFFTTKPAGHGLGLAAALGVVHALHGTLHVDSSPGQGTRIDVTLPACSPMGVVESVASARQAELGWRGHGTVVLADDEPALRQVLGLLLEGAGFRVVAAADGAAAVEAARAHRDTLVALVFDRTMPRLGGVEALRVLRHEGLHAPAILMSGYAPETPDEILHEKLGRLHLLTKPFQTDALLDALRAVLANA